MLSLKDISYKTRTGLLILDNINLEIKKGEFVVITGKSGSGKSTLGSVINGLISHYYDGVLTGEAYLNGKDIRTMELSQIGKKVGTVFQDPRSQFFMLDPFNEVAFGLCNMRLNKDEIKQRVTNSLRIFGIENLKEKSIFKLSSGEKQKVAIASCYAMDPDVYLFDEPTANLDIQSIFDLKDILRELKNNGKTIIVLEHRLFYLTELLDRIIVLNDGKIEGEYSSQSLIDIQRKHRDIRRLYLNDLKVVNHNEQKIMKTPILEVKNLSYFHSKKENTGILKDISITAFGNEIIGIIGENGVGKTTFAGICAGLLKETSGTVFIQGKKYVYKKRLGKVYFVMQDSDFQLFAESVNKELSIGKSGAMLTDEEKAAILSRFEILDFKNRHPMTLSRGQKQRLTIATAVSSESNVIFFDEPTSGLDKNSMDLVSNSILEISDTNKTLFIISHDYEFLLSVCNRIVYFKDGSIQADFKLNNDTKKKLWELLSKGR
ncbi:energy-coupling factor ABC transporter ATP-binding protein [Treponema sp. Marseille-Q3903]|uniref:ABC transporter ATP-binding protein n=1 Tax=Treponema sp. Marseille-Q3903 TaxID=2766703 RepID=UPI00165201A2|nr:energy-coupling factor ABC transporter ATP-binding protein [Treponema sp. Marseille-Q3903]